LPPGIEFHQLDRKLNRQDYLRFLLMDHAQFLKSGDTHVLVVQWDGFITNPDAWEPVFLDYDFVGAPWVDRFVGNGGFSLRSRRLIEFVAARGWDEVTPEDVYIGKTLLPELIEHGMSVAPLDVAARFSTELYVEGVSVPCEKSFGFHSPMVLEEFRQKGINPFAFKEDANVGRVFFTTTMTEDYTRAEWLLKTLRHLKSCEVYVATVGYNKPDTNTYRTAYMPPSEQFTNQQGQVLDILPGVQENDCIITADADAIIQRDMTPEEIALFLSLGDNDIGLGANKEFGQDLAFELTLCKMKPGKSLADFESLIGCKAEELMIYNCGFIAAKPAVWRRIRAKYNELWPKAAVFFDNWRCCQLILCATVRMLGINVVKLDAHIHSNGHFDLFEGRHEIKDMMLYLDGRPVLYAHNVGGLAN